MADNTTLNASSGTFTAGDDDIGGVKYQRIKLIHGADGTNDGDTSRSNPLPVGRSFSTRSDTFTAAANGTTVDCSLRPCREFAVQIKCTTATATAWNIVIEGSLNNSQFTTILEHSNAGEFRNAADGETLYASAGPHLYFRSRCVSVTLGSATDIVTTIVGMQ